MDLPKYVKELKELLDLMKSHDLAEVELEEEGQKIRLRKTEPHISAAPMAIQGAFPAVSPAATPGSDAGGDPEAAEEDDELHKVPSPLVGSFYRSPSPEADSFVSEGDRVDEDTVLCIVEAMKVMNEITAGVSGVVREILVENGSAVEFDQPLFKIEIS
ncbi:MAG: acetyl-CoA carboxylase biotin carboxyl carrier protein [Planctomycetota bacterium]|jgi:acetyl-CoA carboxylase biotin carboxyl carrier protein|nr:acetyl-CoA carboxylase biotin carboxyl carrier protein [Planctomycetota bacterium]HBO53162.1 acetyl-CoA carboxylase biotin carboxyl carrier protein [Planctomycetota bacterium]